VAQAVPPPPAQWRGRCLFFQGEPGATATQANDVKRGNVVGSTTTGSTTKGFLRDPSGHISFFAAPVTMSTYTSIWGINNNGDTCGDFNNTVDGTYSGFTVKNNVFIPVSIPGYNVTFYGINDAGLVARSDINLTTGNQVASIYDSTTKTNTPIPMPPGTTGSGATGINHNTVVGWYTDSSGFHGFAYDLTIGFFLPVNHPKAAGLGTLVNNVTEHGDLVGEYFDASGTTHQFMRTTLGWVDFPTPANATDVSIRAANQDKTVGEVTLNTGAVDGLIGTYDAGTAIVVAAMLWGDL
jgi:hypothetical protein